MIPAIGFMVAAYAVARLIQVPMEMYAPGSARWMFAAILSGIAIVVITLCAIDLLLSGTRTSLPGLN